MTEYREGEIVRNVALGIDFPVDRHIGAHTVDPDTGAKIQAFVDVPSFEGVLALVLAAQQRLFFVSPPKAPGDQNPDHELVHHALVLAESVLEHIIEREGSV